MRQHANSRAGPNREPAGLQSILAELDRSSRAGAIDSAFAIAAAALERGFRHPRLHHAAATGELRRRNHDLALALAEEGLAHSPADAPLLVLRASCLAEGGWHEPAAKAFERALEQAPQSYIAAIGLAQALYNAGNYRRAEAHYERIAAAEPGSPDAPAGLALIAVRLGQADRAERLAQAALSRKPGHPAALHARAAAALLRGDQLIAEAVARELIAVAATAPDRSTGLLRLGDALHGQKRYAEAFAAYSAGKSELRRLHVKQFSALESPTAAAERLIGEMADISGWSETPAGAPEHSGNAFILGFPRSGTTLLEEILAAHPDAVSLDERDTLAFSEAEFIGTPGGIARLATIDAATAERHRRAYCDEVERLAPGLDGRLLVDKMPLRSLSLPLLATLFPGAPVLLAVRDPRDVVLSCFRTGFAINPATYEFTGLEQTALLYDAVMRLVAACREGLGLKLRIVRHEQLVEGFEREVRSILKFMGLPWSSQVLGFARSANERMIRTPSANQIRRGLSSAGLGQWKAYRRELEPVLPILRPWVEAWGYPA